MPTIKTSSAKLMATLLVKCIDTAEEVPAAEFTFGPFDAEKLAKSGLSLTGDQTAVAQITSWARAQGMEVS
jgi:hypothetical protein